MNIVEGLEGAADASSSSSGCDCSQIYKNVGNITTLQNDVKKNSNDIIDLQSSVKAILSATKK
jgi:hypothetical protein